MAKRSRLASLPINALVRMRDEIGAILSRKADAMKKELRALGKDYKEVGRIALYGKKKAKATKRASAAKKARKVNARPRTGGNASTSQRGAARRLRALEPGGFTSPVPGPSTARVPT